MARIQDLTKGHLVAIIAEKGIQTDDELRRALDLGTLTDEQVRRDVALATRVRRRRQLEREAQTTANAAADAAFQLHMAAHGALAAEPPIGDDE